jgi:hypothetical protein
MVARAPVKLNPTVDAVAKVLESAREAMVVIGRTAGLLGSTLRPKSCSATSDAGAFPTPNPRIE